VVLRVCVAVRVTPVDQNRIADQCWVVEALDIELWCILKKSIGKKKSSDTVTLNCVTILVFKESYHSISYAVICSYRWNTFTIVHNHY